MGAIARDGDGSKYCEALKRLLMKMPEPGGYLNAATAAFKTYGGMVSPYEEKWFNESMQMYRDNRICLNGLLEALKLFVVKFDDREMEGQTLFEPYPQELATGVDDRRDKDYMKNIVVDLF
jgi:uncharacterized protein YbgA (DUF1722 family)